MVESTRYSLLTWQERRQAREQYIEEQGGKCFYCSANLNSPPPERVLSKPVDESLFPHGFFVYPVHLQHDHNTDMTEGAVHAYCNAVMWQYEGR